MCACVFSGSGASASGSSNQPQQLPGGVTPPHLPVMGLAQAQANNSNNKTGTYSSTSVSASDGNLPEDLQRLMDDWAQEVLIVTHRPRTNSLRISGPQLWDQDPPQTNEQLVRASDVSFVVIIYFIKEVLRMFCV